jgi:hypothetical protein
MKRLAMFGAGTMALAAGLAGAPAAAQDRPAEAKVLLVAESFTGEAVGDPNFHALGDACLTGSNVPSPIGDVPVCGDDFKTGPVPVHGKTPGYLQLTDADNYEAGAIVYNAPLVNEHGIEVTFAQYQYGGTGADGISFFLVDGDTDLTSPGAYGGSLGYAQHGALPGVDGGYLGLGLDAWGNFSADTEGRGTGCPTEFQAPAHLTTDFNRAPDAVALRGPGQGTDGYCLIATTATDQKIGDYSQGELYGTTVPGDIEADTLADAKRLVKLKVGEGEHPRVTRVVADATVELLERLFRK